MSGSPRTIDDGGVRLRALRVLLGDRTPADFAQRIQHVGLSEHAIKDIEAPSRPRKLWWYEATAIAEAVGIHPTYFTAPLERLGDVDPR